MSVNVLINHPSQHISLGEGYGWVFQFTSTDSEKELNRRGQPVADFLPDTDRYPGFYTAWLAVFIAIKLADF